jgi:hypothetical protein
MSRHGYSSPSRPSSLENRWAFRWKSSWSGNKPVTVSTNLRIESAHECRRRPDLGRFATGPRCRYRDEFMPCDVRGNAQRDGQRHEKGESADGAAALAGPDG